MKQLVVCLALVGLVVTSVGCGGCTPTQAYVEADRATYKVIAPAYLEYIEADAGLTAEAKERRKQLVQTWDLRIRKMEETWATK